MKKHQGKKQLILDGKGWILPIRCVEDDICIVPPINLRPQYFCSLFLSVTFSRKCMPDDVLGLCFCWQVIVSVSLRPRYVCIEPSGMVVSCDPIITKSCVAVFWGVEILPVPGYTTKVRMQFSCFEIYNHTLLMVGPI